MFLLFNEKTLFIYMGILDEQGVWFVPDLQGVP